MKSALQSVIDLDDVVIDLHSGFISYAAETLGIDMDVKNHTNFGFYTQYGISDQEFLDMIQTEDCAKRFIPFDTSTKALHKIKQLGVTRNIVTARGYMRDAYNKTAQVLEVFNLPYDNLIIVPSGKTKSDCYNQFNGNVVFLADDATHNISDAIKNGSVENIYLINRPWNSDFEKHHQVKRANSLIDAVYSLERTLSHNNSYSI
jgi:hypothetical protein